MKDPGPGDGPGPLRVREAAFLRRSGRPLDATGTADFYEIWVERHQPAFTVVTSNRTAEWLSMMTGPLLAQSAVGRLVSTARELIIEGQVIQAPPETIHQPCQQCVH